MIDVTSGQARKMLVEAVAVAKTRWISANVKVSGQNLWVEGVPAKRPAILTE
jgi:hypothetical protein